MEAAKKGHFDLIKLLVQSGAHKNAIDMVLQLLSV
jgi:hypothetical protein